MANTGGNTGGNKGNSGTGGSGVNIRAVGAINTLLKDNSHLLNQGLEFQKQINDETLKYNEVLKKINKKKKYIEAYEKMSKIILDEQQKSHNEVLELSKDINKAIRLNNIQEANRLKALIKSKVENLKDSKIELDLLKQKIQLLNQENKIYVKNLKKVNQFTVLTKQIKDDFKSVGGYLQKGYGYLKSWGLTDMEKAIKGSAMQMGILDKQYDSFSKNIQNIANDTIEFGLGIDDITKMQASYSDELGRTVLLSKDAGVQMAALAKVTGLGAEGAGEFAGNMDNIGYSAKRTAEYVEQAMDDASSMGLNSSKVVKAISQNIKMLNKYNFKGGVKGLKEMALETTKMGVSMNMVAPMADKLFDIEGAVEMSAQLQVLGGEWSSLADPFKLMYMARNDMKGLTETIINATKSTAKFNAETGEFDISSLEMQRLRKVAEATGLNFEELAQSAKNAAKFTEIKKQVSLDIDPKTEKYLESISTLDENKKAHIEIDGQDKLISALTSSDKQRLVAIAKDKETMVERAKKARSFEEIINNTITMGKQLLLPILESLTKDLGPKIDEFVAVLKKPENIKKITDFVQSIIKTVETIGKFIIEYPKLSAGILLAFEGIKWFTNGVTLGLGFNSVASAGGATKGLDGMAGGKSLAGGLIGGIGGMALGGALSSAAGYKSTMMGNIGGMLGGTGGMVAAAALAPETFGASLLLPLIGSAVGKYFGDKAFQDDTSTEPKQDVKQYNDAIAFNPNDKFTKVNDGTMIAGTNANGNASLARSISSMMAPGQNSSTGAISPATTNVNLSDLKVSGSIELKINQSMSRELGENLLHDANFIRNISRLINMSISQNTNMVQKA